MNKVTTVSLNGNAFQLEEGGYEALRHYLDTASARLAGNPDREEIISDIEQAIADKFRAILGSYKNVVSTAQVKTVLEELGPVDTGEESGASTNSGADAKHSSESGPSENPETAPRRLYRILEGAMVSGVCNGLAAWFKIDPTIIRAIFVVLTLLTGGVWIGVYLVLVFVIPVASTDAERTAAYGAAATAQEFIRRAREGYYEGMKSFSDRRARREWKRRFRREMHGWGHAMRYEAERGVHTWQQHWHRYWAEHPGAEARWGFALPFLSLFHAAVALLCVLSVITLLNHGEVFGLAVHPTMPAWLAIIVLLIVYRLVVWPVKAMRHLYLHSGPGGRPGPWLFVSAWDTLVWLSFVGVLGWLAYRHMPEVRDAIHAVPATVREGVDAVRDWWRSV